MRLVSGACRGPAEAALRDLPAAAGVWAQTLASDPAATDVAAIKSIEVRTKHDVKAVEYWVRAELKLRGARARSSSGCISPAPPRISTISLTR